MQEKKKEKAGWKTILLYILGVIFAATFVYGVVYSVMNVMSTVSQYTAMGQDIPTSYTVNAIVSGILQLALPSLFFCAGSFALGSLLKGKDVKADDDADAVEPSRLAQSASKIEVTETVEVTDDTKDADDKSEAETADDAEAAKADDVSEEKAEAEKADASDADAPKDEAEKETAEEVKAETEESEKDAE